MVAEFQKIPERFYNCPSKARGINEEDHLRTVQKPIRKNGLKRFEPFMLGLESNRIYSLKSFPPIKNKNGNPKSITKENSYDSASSLTDDDFGTSKRKMCYNKNDVINSTNGNKFINAKPFSKFITKYYHSMNCHFEMSRNVKVGNDPYDKVIKHTILPLSTKVSSHLNLLIDLEGFKMVKFYYGPQDIRHLSDQNSSNLSLPFDKLIEKYFLINRRSVQISALQLYYDNNGNVCQFTVSHYDDKILLDKFKEAILNGITGLYEMCMVEHLTLPPNIGAAHEDSESRCRLQHLARMYKVNGALSQLTMLHEKVAGLNSDSTAAAEQDRLLADLKQMVAGIKSIYDRRMASISLCDAVILILPSLLHCLPPVSYNYNSAMNKDRGDIYRLEELFKSDLTIKLP